MLLIMDDPFWLADETNLSFYSTSSLPFGQTRPCAVWCTTRKGPAP